MKQAKKVLMSVVLILSMMVVLIGFVMHLVTVVALVVFIYLSWKFVKFGLFTGDTTPGLKIPLWLLTSVLLVSGCLMCIHYFVNAIREMKETGK